MKQFLLYIIPSTDSSFLNECKIPFVFLDRLSPSDTGWCDYATGKVILKENELILFSVDNLEEELFLKLTFGDRIREHTLKN